MARRRIFLCVAASIRRSRSITISMAASCPTCCVSWWRRPDSPNSTSVGDRRNLSRMRLRLAACLLGVVLWPRPGLPAPAPARTVDASTLNGKVMCGYQGWFNCEGDGAGRGWVHWTKGRGQPSPKNVKVDLWPDVSELGADERFDTQFKNADGRPAQVFSSFKKATVLRHFEWMRDA